MENSGQQQTTPVIPETPVAEAPVAKPAAATDLKIETLLEECVRRNASDLHLQYGLPPILRIDGALSPVPGTPNLNEPMLKDLIYATLDEDQRNIYEKDKEFDYSFSFGDIARFRVNAFHERGKMAAAFRLIPNHDYESPESNHIDIIDKLDPMNGDNYFALVQAREYI